MSLLDELCQPRTPSQGGGDRRSGLDYHYDLSPRDVQQAESFRTHIAAARETGLPLVIHSREAEEDTDCDAGRAR